MVQSTDQPTKTPSQGYSSVYGRSKRSRPCGALQSRGWQRFSVTSHLVEIFDFAGRVNSYCSYSTVLLSSTEVAIGNEGQWACWHSNKTLQKQVVGQTWPEGYSLLTPLQQGSANCNPQAKSEGYSLLTPVGEGRSGCRRPGASLVAQMVKNLPAM